MTEVDTRPSLVGPYLDAHHHLWDRSALPRWVGDGHPLANDFSAQRLAAAMTATPVRATIAVQSDDSLQESVSLLRTAAATPWIVGVVTWVDPDADVTAQLDTLRGAPGGDALVGCRLSVRGQGLSWLRDAPERAARVVDAISSAGLAVDILADTAGLADVALLAAAVPTARIVLDHLGGPDAARLAAWSRGIAEVAARPNVVGKVSGLTTVLADRRDLEWAVSTAVDLFGPERLVLGSDWPLCTLSGDYAETVDLYAALVDKDPRVVSGTAQAVYAVADRSDHGLPAGHGIQHAPGLSPDIAESVPLIGGPDQILDPDQVRAFVAGALATADLDGKRLCVVIPDRTRSCPLSLVIDAVHRAVEGRVSALTALVALGTHAPMTESELADWLGYDGESPETRYPGLEVRNHAWWDPEALVSLGTIDAERTAELSEGRLRQSVDVRVNRALVEHDVVLILGPVFPHEVVGFSGGNKYLFPGVAGQEIIDLSHWLGALITSASIIGRPGTTPVRAMIDEAAAMVPALRLALCLVVASGRPDLHAIAFGTPEDAWRSAAAVSAHAHVRYLERPVRRVISLMPPKYQDIWTAAKGFYKVEPVVADGGEVVIVAPHISEFSTTHPEIDDIGYHVRDYFLHRWEEFKDVHWGVLAHSTHLRGAGSYDPSVGERPRVRVTLATGIPEATVRAAGLEYADVSTIDLAALEADQDTLVVRDAGEILFRLH